MLRRPVIEAARAAMAPQAARVELGVTRAKRWVTAVPVPTEMAAAAGPAGPAEMPVQGPRTPAARVVREVLAARVVTPARAGWQAKVAPVASQERREMVATAAMEAPVAPVLALVPPLLAVQVPTDLPAEPAVQVAEAALPVLVV